jgi:ubiquinone/menaquinone biosynthesis C-methylase UbiE
MTDTLFWDRIAPKYARKPVADPEAYDAKLALAAGLLRPTDRVLEIGCGTGTTALRLAPHVAHYTGTDAAHGMIAIARAKLDADRSANVTFRQADAADLPDGALFDAVFAFSLLHLVEDLPGTLAAVHAQLRPGGVFLSKTVCTGDAPWPLRALIPALTALRLAPRVRPLGRSALCRHLLRAGFEIERVTYFGARRTSPVIVARRAEREALDAAAMGGG